jgi:hypothetical protein
MGLFPGRSHLLPDHLDHARPDPELIGNLVVGQTLQAHLHYVYRPGIDGAQYGQQGFQEFLIRSWHYLPQGAAGGFARPEGSHQPDAER